MRIHLKQSVILVVGVVCLFIGFYAWNWWTNYVVLK